jgi:hypothetical protein
MTTDSIISKVWSFCTTLRDDGPTIRFFTSQRQIDLAHSGVNHFYYLVLGARSVRPRIVAMRAHIIPAGAINPIVHEVVLKGDLWQTSQGARIGKVLGNSLP